MLLLFWLFSLGLFVFSVYFIVLLAHVRNKWQKLNEMNYRFCLCLFSQYKGEARWSDADTFVHCASWLPFPVPSIHICSHPLDSLKNCICKHGKFVLILWLKYIWGKLLFFGLRLLCKYMWLLCSLFVSICLNLHCPLSLFTLQLCTL